MIAIAALLVAPSLQGAVATAQADATQAAAAILERGGNAVDAAVAAGFALAVSFPEAGNLGGGGFLLYRAPGGGAFFLDFREVAPAAAHAEMYRKADGSFDRQAPRRGWKAAAVPGSVPGLWFAHQRWGALPWDELVAPAVRIAEEGFVIDEREHRALRAAASQLARDPRAAAVFLDAHAAAHAAGTRLRQPELAATLRRVAAEGETPFREGELVQEIVAASEAGGGVLRAEDFRSYEPVLRPVHRIEWRNLTVLSATAPSSGAVFLAQTLHFLGRFPMRAWGIEDARTAQVIGEATALAFQDRNEWLGDPAGFDFDWQRLIDRDYLGARGRQVSPRSYTRPAAPAVTLAEGENTTHFSLVDADGGACSVTTTLNGSYGAKVLAPGGFLMNNEMDDFATAPGEPNLFGLIQGRYNAVVAGRRPLSSMSPVIVEKDGRVDAVLGSPGGSRILSSVLQVLLHRYVFGMSPRRAVLAPRVHRQDHPPILYYESGRLEAGALDRIRALGQPLRRRTLIGDVNAVFRSRSGGWTAVADDRRGGLGLVVD